MVVIFRAHIDTRRSFMADKLSSLLSLAGVREVHRFSVQVVARHGWQRHRSSHVSGSGYVVLAEGLVGEQGRDV